MAPSMQTMRLMPLAQGSILLPGSVARVPVTSRKDVPAILSDAYQEAHNGRAELSQIYVGCVPLKAPPPELGVEEGSGNAEDYARHGEIDPGHARKGDLFKYGTVARILGIERNGGGETVLRLEGLSRLKVRKIVQERPFVSAEVTVLEETRSRDDHETRLRFAHLKSLAQELLTIIRLTSVLPRATSSPISPILARRIDVFIGDRTVDDAGQLADFMCNVLGASFEERLDILASWDVKERMEKVSDLVKREVDGLKNKIKVTSIISTNLPIGSDQASKSRNALIRRAAGGFGGFKAPPFMPSGGNDNGDEDGNELQELQRKLDAADLTPEAQKAAEREMKRIKKMNPAQAEHQVCRNYLENLAEIPWRKMAGDQLDADTVSRARKQFDDDHYGLETIKKRLLEYLAVLRLKQARNSDLEHQIAEITKQEEGEGKEEEAANSSPQTGVTSKIEGKVQLLRSKVMVDRSPILLLVGPPGTGKTSLAKSVAISLGRKFHRISLGGVRDEAEIRGHRRTYVAAMPGLIVQGLKKVGVSNPVFLLDEIDKVGGSNFHGDPSAAMLEVLDPEQNHAFTDHYVNIPIDLSKVLFIATANTLDTIPPPLLDRMETINLSGYTTLEKHHIATQHLLPKQITTNGLQNEQINFLPGVIDKIITSYTRESGVRNLEREIGSVCRRKAVEYAEATDNKSPSAAAYSPNISAEELEGILGIEKFEEEIAEKTSRPGVVTGLVAYSTGGNGSILFIEVADMPGSGRVQLTGTLGDVLKESVEVALTWVKAHAFELGLTTDPSEDIMKNRSVHVHCPAGATPKDGPSAGLAHTIALISLFSGKAVPPTLAMTGEVSLRGRVTAVGGIKEKLIGALRAGVKTVLLPAQNRKDARELPQEVKDGLEIIHVSHITEAMGHVWPDAHWPGEHNFAGLESRL